MQPSWRPRPIRAAATLAAALLLASCTAGGSGSSTDAGSSPSTEAASPSASASSAATPSAPSSSASPTPPAPAEESCYRLTLDQLREPTNSSRAVDCSKQHDAVTFFVGRLDTYVDGHAVAVDSHAVGEQLQRVCPRRMAAFLGGSQEARRLSRFHTVWFSPTIAQSDQGAAWFRCDLIAFGRDEGPARLPAPGKLRGVLGRDEGLSTYGLCGTAAPDAKGFHRVMCREKHSWTAISTIDISGGSRYPGRKAVSDAGDSSCKSQAQARSGDSLKYRYGWEWPSREQWNGGQHFGYCWVPA